MRLMRQRWLAVAHRVLARAPGGLRRIVRNVRFRGSSSYWETRYAKGGTSGPGSYGRLALFKAEVLNNLVEDLGIDSVIEFGCGDGNQLELAVYPSYVGLDVSRTAIRLCERKFREDRTKSFFLYDPTCFTDNHRMLMADASISLDVIFHLVEDDVFALYLGHLFGAAKRFVIIYSSDSDLVTGSPHERHRNFSRYVAKTQPAWQITLKVPNRFSSVDDNEGSLSDFYVFTRRAETETASGEAC